MVGCSSTEVGHQRQSFHPAGTSAARNGSMLSTDGMDDFSGDDGLRGAGSECVVLNSLSPFG